MRHSQEDGPFDETARRYVVIETERWEAEVNAIVLRLTRRNPQYAGRWLERLSLVVRGLPKFPGPLAHSIDQEASVLYDAEIRRLLYFGPGKPRSGTPYRILFTVVPLAPGDAPDEPQIIRILRILHGAQLLTPTSSEPKEEE